MKKIHFYLLLLFGSISFCFAQPVKDFTTTDLDGNEHSLYIYLDQGKHVVITFLFDG